MRSELDKLIDNQINELHKIKQRTGVGFGSDEAIAEIVGDSTRNGFELCRSMADSENAIIADSFHANDLTIKSLTDENAALREALQKIKDYFCACSIDDEIIPQVVAHDVLARYPKAILNGESNG